MSNEDNTPEQDQVSSIPTQEYVWPDPKPRKSQRKNVDLGDWKTAVNYGVTPRNEKLSLADLKMMCVPAHVEGIRKMLPKMRGQMPLRSDGPARTGRSGTPRRQRFKRKKSYFSRLMGNSRPLLQPESN